MVYSKRLQEREAELGRPIRIALIGAGQMGTGFVAQVTRISGMQISVIADTLVERALGAYASVGVSDVVASGSPEQLHQAVQDGRAVATQSAAVAVELPVDFVMEATGVPDVGAHVALSALLAGKDVGSLNVECDVTVGLILHAIAERAGLVYSVCRGDEPAEAKRLVDYARDLAFEVICAGKGKNNVLDTSATPTSLTAEARRRHMNPKMLTSFVDGSKAMIEMAALANATGLSVSKRGMYGPESSVAELHHVFALQEDGGVLDRPGVVDYCTGSVAPGVFVVVRSDNPSVIAEMDYLKMGAGPYFAFYRPYHLASIEAPLTVAEAVLDRTPSLVANGWHAEVATAAKKNLSAGDVIDGIGGDTVHGVIEDANRAFEQGLVPLGLVAGARLRRDVPRAELLHYADLDLDECSTILSLRRLQDKLYFAAASNPARATAPAARG